MRLHFLSVLLLVAACGDDSSGSGGPGQTKPNGDTPPGELPSADSFVEIKGTEVGVGRDLASAITMDKTIVC